MTPHSQPNLSCARPSMQQQMMPCLDWTVKAGLASQTSSRMASGCQAPCLMLSSSRSHIHQSWSSSSTCSRLCAAWLRASTASSSASSPGARLSCALHACCQRAVVIAPCRALHLPAACSPSPVLAMGSTLHQDEVLGTPPTSRSLPGQQFPIMPRPLCMIPSVWCRKHLQVGSCCWVRGWQGEAQVHRLALQLCMWYPHSATQCWEPLKLACARDACLYSLSALKPPIA